MNGSVVKCDVMVRRTWELWDMGAQHMSFLGDIPRPNGNITVRKNDFLDFSLFTSK